jgi:hypothetical protein
MADAVLPLDTRIASVPETHQFSTDSSMNFQQSATTTALHKWKSKSKLHYDRRSVGHSLLESCIYLDQRPIFLLLLIYFRNLQVSCCGIPLTRGWVYSLQLLLGMASAVFLGFSSCGTHDHILMCHISDSPTCRARFLYLLSLGTE